MSADVILGIRFTLGPGAVAVLGLDDPQVQAEHGITPACGRNSYRAPAETVARLAQEFAECADPLGASTLAPGARRACKRAAASLERQLAKFHARKQLALGL